MTTSEESTTLYSSPQMRLDWPLSKPFSREPFFSPSNTSSTSSLCFSTYLSNHHGSFMLPAMGSSWLQPSAQEGSCRKMQSLEPGAHESHLAL